MRRKLLLADASTIIQRVVALTFASEDMQVIAVSDGEQAIQRIPVERPDIVLATIGTAKRSGYDVAAFVKAHPDLSHVPVLLLASAFEPVDEERARQVTSAGVLVKPFEPQQMIARVRDLLPSTSQPSVSGAVTAGPVSSETLRAEPAAAAGPAAPILEPDSRAPNPESRIRSPGSPVPNSEPRSPSPESQVPGSGAGRTGSLDDYFDRLDAALSSRSASRIGPPSVLADVSEDDGVNVTVPSIDAVLGPVALAPRPGEPLAPSVPEAQAPEGQPAPGSELPSVPVAITDELVDRIAQRVVDRMSGDTAKQLLTGLVERLVREELAGGQLE